MDQEERVKDDCLGQRDGQNRVHQNRRKRSRISAHRRGHAETSYTDADADAHGGEADVNASGDFC